MFIFRGQDLKISIKTKTYSMSYRGGPTKSDFKAYIFS